MTLLNETDKEKVSFIYYNLGNIYYHGFTSKEPDLETGLVYFIISSYFGSPQSKYKLSIILSNNIFEQISKGKKYKNLLNSLDIMKIISRTDFYIKNFDYLIKEYNSEEFGDLKKKKEQNLKEFKNNLAVSFLYSATLQNYSPAKKILAYKLNK